MGRAEWGGDPVCWRLGLYFCFVCCLNEVSCTGYYWWLGDARPCIQVVSFVWILTIWHSLGLVLWYSRSWSQCSHSKCSGLDLQCCKLYEGQWGQQRVPGPQYLTFLLSDVSPAQISQYSHFLTNQKGRSLRTGDILVSLAPITMPGPLQKLNVWSGLPKAGTPTAATSSSPSLQTF